MDGTKVAFVESTGGASYFHVLVLPNPIPTPPSQFGSVFTLLVPWFFVSHTAVAVWIGVDPAGSHFVHNAHDGWLHDDPHHRNCRDEFEFLPMDRLRCGYGIRRRRQWLAI